jgi:hypothetical protein
MRTLSLAFALLAVLACGACKCTAEKAAVSRIQATHEKVAKKLLDYVDKDPALKPEDKKDWRLLVESDQRNVEALRKALED